MIKRIVGRTSKSFVRGGLLLVSVICITFLVSSMVLSYPPEVSKIYFNPSLQRTLKVSTLPKESPLIIFPRNFKERDLGTYYDHYFGERSNVLKVFKYSADKQPFGEDILSSRWKQHKSEIFLAGSQSNSCNDLKRNIEFDISNYIPMDNEADIVEMARKLHDQVKNDDAFEELEPFFKDDIPKQIKNKKTLRHFFKFSASSVWLEQYGVHYSISRVMYSPPGGKKGSVISLIYAQIYDENWSELKDVELLMPISDPDTKESVYKNLKFPCFLPVPFYHNTKYRGKRWYGPEDPRIMLYRNEHGLDEPIMIFNAYHRRVVKEKYVDESNMNITFNYYRLMFVSWPFRFQIGKGNLEGINDASKEGLYNKIIELRRENTKRLRVQKNWTPFVSLLERNPDDTHVYFVYRWEKLEVMKCPIKSFTRDGTALCESVYKADSNLGLNAPVGEMRGGTEMLPLNHIYKDTMKDVWISFARAHIKLCGCGSSMYRPNLSLMIRDESGFRVTHMGKFMSLDIAAHGWSFADKPCAERNPSVIIPNSISSWSFDKTDDYLTLSLSVADDTNVIVHFKNFLHSIDPFVREALSSNEEKSDKEVPNNNIDSGDNLIKCALNASRDFCKSFGLDHSPAPPAHQ